MILFQNRFSEQHWKAEFPKLSIKLCMLWCQTFLSSRSRVLLLGWREIGELSPICRELRRQQKNSYSYVPFLSFKLQTGHASLKMLPAAWHNIGHFHSLYQFAINFVNCYFSLIWLKSQFLSFVMLIFVQQLWAEFSSWPFFVPFAYLRHQ